MDMWRFYDITHRRRRVLNPMNSEKLDRLCNDYNLDKGSSVLEIACGKGEHLIRLAALYDIIGVGVDKSPIFLKEARHQKESRVPGANITFIEKDGADYRTEDGSLFDMTACIGAEWIFGGRHNTLKAISDMTEVGGLVTLGTIHWMQDPADGYLEFTGLKREDYGSYEDNVRLGEDMGLECIHTVMSSKDDWDQYETMTWWAADEPFKDHPDDPDNPQIREMLGKDKEAYIRWGRDLLGWGIYVYRKKG